MKSKITILSILADFVNDDDVYKKKVNYDLLKNMKKTEKRIYRFFNSRKRGKYEKRRDK